MVGLCVRQRDGIITFREAVIRTHTHANPLFLLTSDASRALIIEQVSRDASEAQLPQ